jgi:hypothetical protein
MLLDVARCDILGFGLPDPASHSRSIVHRHGVRCGVGQTIRHVSPGGAEAPQGAGACGRDRGRPGAQSGPCQPRFGRLKEAADWLSFYRRFGEESFDRLEAVLATNGETGHELIVTVTFEDLGAATQLTLRQAIFESVAWRDDHTRGGTSCFHGWCMLTQPGRGMQ